MKDLDTFFCAPSAASLFTGILPKKPRSITLLTGFCASLRASALAEVCAEACKTQLPCIRLLHAHAADRPVAVFLPTQARLWADGIYFPEIAQKYAEKIHFSLNTDALAATTPDEKTVAALHAHTKASEDFSQEAERLLCAAADLKQESMALFSPCIQKAKLLNYVFQLTERYVPSAPAKDRGTVCRGFTCSGVTDWGVHTFCAPCTGDKTHTMVLKDNIGAVAGMLLRGLAAAFTACGQDVRLYACGLTGAPEHLHIPACSLSVFTENTAHPFPLPCNNVVSACRFTDLVAAQARLPALRFNTTEMESLLEEAAFVLYEASEAERACGRLARKAIHPERLNAFRALLLRDL